MAVVVRDEGTNTGFEWLGWLRKVYVRRGVEAHENLQLRHLDDLVDHVQRLLLEGRCDDASKPLLRSRAPSTS